MQYTKTIILTFICFSLVYLFSGGCKKGNNNSITKNNGIITFTGNPDADGCGWNIVINKVSYHPDNLDAAFQHDSLKVSVDYTLLTSKYLCGDFPNTGIPNIHITSIKQDN